MPSQNLWKLGATEEQVRSYFTHKYKNVVPINLCILFNIAMADKNLFPSMNLSNNSTFQDYIDRWVCNYTEAEANPARLRVASPKGSCNDPAVKTIVKMITQTSDEDASVKESHHNLFMSAENVQGALLEEYIDSIISDHGWIWCKGNILRSVDFCTIDGSRLLQIKNKSNSENSSSSSVRDGTKIEKWYRLATKVEQGEKIPSYKWDNLNQIIESVSGKKCLLNETDYVKYVEEVAIANPYLITDQ